MSYVWNMLRPFLKDRHVWLAVASWALAVANTKLHLGMPDAWIDNTAALISAWALSRVVHLKQLGGDGKMPDVPPSSDDQKL